jgi:hypothetical protein
MELANESLLDPIRACKRHPRKQSDIEAEGDCDDTGKHSDAELAPYPFARPQRSLRRSENLAPMRRATASDDAAPAA